MIIIMSSNCNCNPIISQKKECKCNMPRECVPQCECDDNRSILDCKLDYLKPITYDDLFDEKSNKCTDYNLIVKKLTEARNAFFIFQTSIYNFINDCTRLKQKIREDISGNDLHSLTHEYKVLLYNLITEIALGMRKKIKEDNSILISFEVPVTQPNRNIDNIQNLWPTNIVYTDDGGVDTLITSIPSVILYLTVDLQLQVRFSTPTGISYSNLTFDSTYIKSQACKSNDVYTKNMTPSLIAIDSTYGFVNSDHANNIFEDLINYNNDCNILTHNLKDVVARLDGIVLSIENSYRSIVQKIKTEKFVAQNKK